jgi:hypothetical protein
LSGSNSMLETMLLDWWMLLHLMFANTWKVECREKVDRLCWNAANAVPRPAARV